MNMYKHRMSGMTLLETMLVALIGVAVVLVSIRQYQQYRSNVDAQGVAYNVNVLLEAASRYYQANCRSQTGSTGTPIAGTGALDPVNSPNSPFYVSMASLLSQGYLSQPLPANPIIDTSSSDGGYGIQFLQDAPIKKTIKLQNGGTVDAGSVYIWRMQVAVKIKNSANAQMYLTAMGGTCISTTNQKNGVTSVATCEDMSKIPTGVYNAIDWSAVPTYIVWETLPGMVNSKASSGLWPTNAAGASSQPYQMYQKYPILLNTSGKVPESSYGQNYLCGS